MRAAEPVARPGARPAAAPVHELDDSAPAPPRQFGKIRTGTFANAQGKVREYTWHSRWKRTSGSPPSNGIASREAARERQVSSNQLVVELAIEALGRREWPQIEAEIRLLRSCLFTAQAIARDMRRCRTPGRTCGNPTLSLRNRAALPGRPNRPLLKGVDPPRSGEDNT